MKTPTDVFLIAFAGDKVQQPTLQETTLFIYKLFHDGDNDIKNLFLRVGIQEKTPENNDMRVYGGMLIYCLTHKLMEVHSFFVTRNEAEDCTVVEVNLVLLMAGKSYLHSSNDISPL